MSKDLRYVKVYVSIFDKDKEKVESIMKVLENVKLYIRREILKRISLRFILEIIFEFDNFIEYGVWIF